MNKSNELPQEIKPVKGNEDGYFSPGEGSSLYNPDQIDELRLRLLKGIGSPRDIAPVTGDNTEIDYMDNGPLLEAINNFTTSWLIKEWNSLLYTKFADVDQFSSITDLDLDNKRQSSGDKRRSFAYNTNKVMLIMQSIRYFFPNLLTLSCNSNNLTQLPVLPSGLQKLSCLCNELTQLPALPPSLQELSCSYNNLMQLSTLPSGLKVLSCGYNPLPVLPPLPDTLTNLDCQNSKIGHLSCLPDTLIELNYRGSPVTELILPEGCKRVNGKRTQIQDRETQTSIDEKERYSEIPDEIRAYRDKRKMNIETYEGYYDYDKEFEDEEYDDKKKVFFRLGDPEPYTMKTAIMKFTQELEDRGMFGFVEIEGLQGLTMEYNIPDMVINGLVKTKVSLYDASDVLSDQKEFCDITLYGEDEKEKRFQEIYGPDGKAKGLPYAKYMVGADLKQRTESPIKDLTLRMKDQYAYLLVTEAVDQAINDSLKQLFEAEFQQSIEDEDVVSLRMYLEGSYGEYRLSDYIQSPYQNIMYIPPRKEPSVPFQSGYGRRYVRKMFLDKQLCIFRNQADHARLTFYR